MTINLSSFSRAIAELEGSLEYAESARDFPDERMRRYLRAATIQAFESTYELAIKTLRRHLEANAPSPRSSGDFNFSGLIRTGFAQGLLNRKISAWRNFHRDRGITSHAYDKGKALEIFESVPIFFAESRFLRDRIARHQAQEG